MKKTCNRNLKIPTTVVKFWVVKKHHFFTNGILLINFTPSEHLASRLKIYNQLKDVLFPGVDFLKLKSTTQVLSILYNCTKLNTSNYVLYLPSILKITFYNGTRKVLDFDLKELSQRYHINQFIFFSSLSYISVNIIGRSINITERSHRKKKQ